MKKILAVVVAIGLLVILGTSIAFAASLRSTSNPTTAAAAGCPQDCANFVDANGDGVCDNQGNCTNQGDCAHSCGTGQGMGMGMGMNGNCPGTGLGCR